MAEHSVALTPQEQDIFDRTLKTGDLNIFTKHFFRLPYSGTWYTTEDRVEQYDALYHIWNKLGKPDNEFVARLDGVETLLKIMWDDYYGGYPMILLPHGYCALPWIEQFTAPTISKGLAITGTGSGKTSGIAIAALSYCALYPGFGFRNVAQQQVTSQLMLGEVEKWVRGSAFLRFVVKTRGVSNLWKERPYPTLKIDVFGFPSSFACQTLGRIGGTSSTAARTVLGQEEDWINVEEAQLVEDIHDVKNVLTTRLRGTRATGIPRISKETWITNPGDNPGLRTLMDTYRDLADSGDKSVLVLEGLSSRVNIYITQRQLEQQEKEMTQLEQDRWLGGQMSAVYMDHEIGDALFDLCYDEALDKFVIPRAKFDEAVGLQRYELPFDPDRNYVVVGDVGKSHLVGLHSINVPAVMVLDITDFLVKPIKLVALYWVSGEGTYNTFIGLFKRAMTQYRCTGYYDATSVQTMIEDLDAAWESMPTTPVLFSGQPGKKAWAIAVLVKLLSDRQFAFPEIKGLWHQARVYKSGKKKLPNDLIDCLLIFTMAMQIEGTLWDQFVERYKWKGETDEQERREVSAQPMDSLMGLRF